MAEEGSTPRGAVRGAGVDERVAVQALAAVSALVRSGLFLSTPEGDCFYLNDRLHDAHVLASRTGSARMRLVGPPGRGGAELDLVCLGDDGAVETISLPARVVPLLSREGSVASYLGAVASEDEGPLEASERLVAALVEEAGDIVTVLEPDGRWRYSSPALARRCGVGPDADEDGFVGLLPAEERERLTSALERARENPAEQEEIELRLVDANGAELFMDTSVENRLDDPAVRGFLLLSRDVTDSRLARARLIEANETLSTLIASLHLAVLVEDESRRIVFTNNAFVTLFEVEAGVEELLGRTIEELGPEFYRRFGDPTVSAERPRTEKILSTRRRVTGDWLVMPDGRVVERDFLPIVVGEEYRGHVWIFRDVSAQARAEKEWDRLLHHQREENERLVKLDSAKSGFLAEISHELRTPLTSIVSFTELLADGLGRDDPAEQAEFCDIIKKNADRLLRLVDDLLFLNRIETGTLSLEWGSVDLPTLVSTAVSSIAPAVEQKSISLTSSVESGPPVRADGARLAQVVDIVLSNAVKFTPEGGRIAVTAGCDEDHWTMQVRDSGIGVPRDEAKSLFERFFRASNARKARLPGSGLGLSVAHAVVELHGGTIALESSEGSGTTVTVTLPVELPPEGTDEELTDGPLEA